MGSSSTAVMYPFRSSSSDVSYSLQLLTNQGCGYGAYWPGAALLESPGERAIAQRGPSILQYSRAAYGHPLLKGLPKSSLRPQLPQHLPLIPFRSSCMYQQPNPGYGQPNAQQPIYPINQDAGLYYTSTGVAEYVGRGDGSSRAYAMPGHPPYHSPSHRDPGMRSSADDWCRISPFDQGIPYHPQVAEGLSGFWFEDGQALPHIAGTSHQFSLARRPSHTAAASSWPKRWQVCHDLTAQVTEDQPLAYSNPGSYPLTSPLVSPSSATSDVDVEPPRHGEDFIQESFPRDDSEHERLRAALTEVMNADWKRHHIKEPDEDLLLQFQQYDRTEGRWNCRFSKDGKLCDRSTSKKDHAKGHIRWHIDHRPFFCENPCRAGDVNCTKQYTAMESLKKHQNGKLECKFCKASMLKGNLQRHIASSCKGSSA